MSEKPTIDVDVRERGAERDGQPQLMDRRLFMQLLVVRTAHAPDTVPARLGAALKARGVASVIYEDVSDPYGFGVLSWSENPEDFVKRFRPALLAADVPFELRHDMTMLGRSYSSGFEPDLEYWLLRRPAETALNPAWPWAVWYPLRRTGAFERLEGRDRGQILREHAGIGKAYGAANLAHDIRLACHGLDAHDNEFVIGLIGEHLHPLSHVVQAMRRTRQTAEFMAQMGPFFVGHVVFRNSGA